jgi:hypothetical protein
MPTLTKLFLGGIKHVETVTLTHPATGEEVQVNVRPLSDGESQEIQKLLAGGLEVSGDKKASASVKGDVSKIAECRILANRKAIVRGLVSEEKWTEEEIAAMWPPGWVSDVAAVIYRISGIQAGKATGDEVEEASFRGDRGSAGGPGPQ